MFELFITFLKIGCFTFGGGLAIFSLLEDEVVKKKRWLKTQDILDYYSISQCIPGIIIVNVATLIGYRRKGIAGAFVATIAVILPIVSMVALFAGILEAYMHNQYLMHALAGIRVGVIAVILDVLILLFKQAIKDKVALIILGVTLLALFTLKISAILVVLAAAPFGWIIWRLKK